MVFVLIASMGTLVIVNVVCACVALTIGFAAGVWFFGAGEAIPDESAGKQDAMARQLEQANERAMMASSRLKDLASGIACDVGAHNTQVQEINDNLRELATGEAVDAAVMEAIGKIVESNSTLQERLAIAEQQIEAQSAELRSYESEARTDSLTGLANRRAFDDELGRRFAAWERKQSPFTLLLMDIDHFKIFNDTHGHQAGDEVLRHVGRLLIDATREMDVSCRYGGEEFAVIMPDTRTDDARVVAERIRTHIETACIEFESKKLQVTTSVGLAEVNDSDDRKLILKRTDDALYRSKDAGRNCGHLHDGTQCIPITPGIEAKPTKAEAKRPDNPATQVLDALPDERIFSDELRRRLAESHRFGVNLSVMYVEIRDYDQIRQKYGMAIARATLDCVARFVHGALREMDLLARLEGGRFVAMLPGSCENEARQVAVRLQAALTGSAIPLGDKKLQLSVMHGIAQAMADDTAQSILDRSIQAATTRAAASLQPTGV